MKIGIIDIGIGNIRSVVSMLNKIGYNSIVLSKTDIEDCSIIILPGVGAFDYAMLRLNDSGWSGLLKEVISNQNNNIRLLGICLGMQLLCDGSEEGALQGLSLIPGCFKSFSRIRTNTGIKVPHMGWNTVNYNDKGYWLVGDHSEEHRYYFVHSFYYQHESEQYILGKTNYGANFGSVIGKDNVVGFQFHPEKSHKFGMELLTNFLNKSA